MAGTWHMPTDPSCPVVESWNSSFWDDPMTDACDCAGEIADDWEKKHLMKCKRCQEYGCANIEVQY